MPDSPPALPPIPPGWAGALDPEAAPILTGLRRFLEEREAAGHVVYPAAPLRLLALERTPLDAVRAVILGQDPYHGPGQAHGLAFSVPPGVPKPPSLRNIVRELGDDLALPDPGHGCLTHWADNGVLLLNSVLTVEDGQPGSHAGRGWEAVTRAAIMAVSRRAGRAAFVLWGAHAAKLAAGVDESRHLVLRSAHPSPLAARRGFFGSRPFSRTNDFLAAHGLAPVDWALPPA